MVTNPIYKRPHKDTFGIFKNSLLRINRYLDEFCSGDGTVYCHIKFFLLNYYENDWKEQSIAIPAAAVRPLVLLVRYLATLLKY